MYTGFFISAAAGALFVVLATGKRDDGTLVQSGMVRTVLTLTLAGFFGGVVVGPITALHAFGAGAALALALHDPAVFKRLIRWCTGGGRELSPTDHKSDRERGDE